MTEIITELHEVEEYRDLLKNKTGVNPNDFS